MLIDIVQLCSKIVILVYAHKVFCRRLGGECGLRAVVSQREEGVERQAQTPQICPCHAFLTIQLTDSYPPEAAFPQGHPAEQERSTGMSGRHGGARNTSVFLA